MKSIAFTAATLAALFASTASHALTLNLQFDPLSTTSAYFAPLGGFNSGPGTYLQNTVGSVPDVTTSPFADTTTHYDSVGADAIVTFGQGPSPVVQAAFREGPADPSFGTGNGTFSFVWGSPDDYNKLSFYQNGNFIGSVIGTDGNSHSVGSGSYLATVSGIGAFNGVRFESTGANAFEFAAVSPVPLPASLPMFGGAVLALCGFAMFRRGRSEAKAAI